MGTSLPLPRGWNRRVRSSIVHILALSHYAFTAFVARAANERNRRTRLRAEIDQLHQEGAASGRNSGSRTNRVEGQLEPAEVERLEAKIESLVSPTKP